MSTSRELDKIRILKYLDKTNESRRFVNEIESILFFDKMFLRYVDSYAQDTTPQHVILKGILKNCNNLLTVLQPLKLDESDPQYCEDFPTASLIKISRWQLNQDSWLRREVQPTDNTDTDSTRLSEAIEELSETFKHIADKDHPQHEKNTSNDSEIYETVPGDYPSAAIDSIEKLRDAVVRAVDMAKPKGGRKTYHAQEFIRKDKLGREFVEAYWRCFNRFPPITIGGPVYNSFVVFLFAANLSGPGEENCYKNAITNAKRRLKRIVARSNKHT
jgi:hypothetical protein